MSWRLLEQTLMDPRVPPDSSARVAQVLDFLRADRIRVGDAATLLGVSENTVKNWVRLGRFPGAYRTEGGHWRLVLDEVLALRDSGRLAVARNRAGAPVVVAQVEGDPFAGLPDC